MGTSAPASHGHDRREGENAVAAASPRQAARTSELSTVQNWGRGSHEPLSMDGKELHCRRRQNKAVAPLSSKGGRSECQKQGRQKHLADATTLRWRELLHCR